ncbi:MULTISPECIES: hypothetical protein [Oxalobacteraceae]|uniref:hypothetical protein n=1 Tax=Herminiimonas sp. Marseille-P9896 TaxID=2742211 RepID=UPI00158C5EAC|nr:MULTISPECIES: hypothetical protein [Oxalobacteraceae]
MAFDPVTFFTLAADTHQAAGHEEEEKVRTVIGRAYYSAFLCARNAAGLTGTNAAIHQVTIEHYINNGNSAVGNRLNDLRTSRNDADYDCGKKFTKTQSGKALSQANAILVNLGLK